MTRAQDITVRIARLQHTIDEAYAEKDRLTVELEWLTLPYKGVKCCECQHIGGHGPWCSQGRD
jgi:hypothetical protein